MIVNNKKELKRVILYWEKYKKKGKNWKMK